MALPQLPKPITESLKEAGRVVGLGIVSWLLTEGVLDMVINWIFGTKLDTAQKTIIISALFTALRSVDKWLHEQGKATGSESMSLGLTRF